MHAHARPRAGTAGACPYLPYHTCSPRVARSGLFYLRNTADGDSLVAAIQETKAAGGKVGHAQRRAVP